MNELDTNADIIQDDIVDKYLTFGLSGQVYGLPIKNITEIVKMQPVTQMPEFPVYAKGIINMRGQIMPLIDLNLRFGNSEREYTDRTCIVIVDIDSLRVGFIVDEVDEVVEINQSLIAAPPNYSAESGNRYITGIGRLPGRMVLLLNGSLILSGDGLNMFSVSQ